jgi:choline dehydrogenase-like flavoprotein
VLGGCSSHNSCIAFWAPAEDLDDWAALGLPGWSAADIYPLYQRLETNDGPGDHHGRSGRVTIRSIPPHDPTGVALLRACEQTGIPRTEFNSGKTVTHGANWFQINAREDGTRPSSGNGPIWTSGRDMRAKKLTFDGKRCTGVAYLTDLFHSVQVKARREVIVSAGAIDTPKLLMLSGIGPAEHLREVGVDVLVDLPGVGENLQDHPEGLVQWDALQPMVAESTQWWEIGIFTTTEAGLDRPDLMFHYGSVPFDLNTLRHGYPTTENGFRLTPNVTRSRSTGTVRLRTRDFRDKPKVDPRYSDPYDLRVMTYGVRLARKIVSQPAMAEWAGAELAPGKDAQTDDEIAEYLRKTHNTVYHPSCTAKMGTDDDPLAVLARLRVRGVDGLRVADGSAMPFLIAVNPCITTMAIEEKCTDMITEDARG